MSASHADLENRISEIIAGWIPGEGITEVGVELNDADNDNINFSILGVRSIEKSDDSNFFTQFSLKNEEKKLLLNEKQFSEVKQTKRSNELNHDEIVVAIGGAPTGRAHARTGDRYQDMKEMGIEPKK